MFQLDLDISLKKLHHDLSMLRCSCYPFSLSFNSVFHFPLTEIQILRCLKLTECWIFSGYIRDFCCFVVSYMYMSPNYRLTFAKTWFLCLYKTTSYFSFFVHLLVTVFQKSLPSEDRRWVWFSFNRVSLLLESWNQPETRPEPDTKLCRHSEIQHIWTRNRPKPEIFKPEPNSNSKWKNINPHFNTVTEELSTVIALISVLVFWFFWFFFL